MLRLRGFEFECVGLGGRERRFRKGSGGGLLLLLRLFSAGVREETNSNQFLIWHEYY